MDYEKKYKEALGWMQSLYNGLHGKTKEEAEKYFPELQESEDERIRKRLIEFFEDWGETKSHCWGKSVNKILAWLEKQGEQKPIMNVPTREVILAIWDLGNEWKELTNGSISTEYGTQLDYIQKHWNESEYYLREKQSEKKLTFNADDWYVSKVDGKIRNIYYSVNKIEPKFNVGDWIANDYCAGKVIALTDDAYLLDSGQGIPFSCEHNAHLWTIQDAKDGDVLACGDKVTDCPFIFHNLTKELNPRSYCGVNTLCHFQDNDENGGFWCKSDEVRPATKEQRDTLFAKMQEAGYEWDAEKKELKLLISNGGDFESNNSKQKPTWSDEDENVLEDIEEAIINYWHGDTQNILLDWIKSLKERLI